MILRPYQSSLVSDIRAAYASGLKSVCAVAPTGAGKSLCFAEIARLVSAKGKSTCIVVHRDTLLRQASQKIREIGVPYGIIAAGYTPGPRETVQIASAQSLVRRLDRHAFDFLIFDEAHLSCAPTWKRIIAHYPKAHVLGFTATPVLGNGRGLDQVYRKLVLGPTISSLIADGFLVSPRTYGPVRKVDLSDVRTRAGDYALDDLERVVDTPKIIGDALAEAQKICPRAQTMIFCFSILHSRNVAEQFRAAGLRAESVDGTMDRQLIRDRIEALASGQIQYLASCDLLGIGFDAPSVACAISLRPTMSVGLYIQQAGRALRPVYAPGHDLSTRAGRLAAIAASSKPFAILADHVGNFVRHGLVIEDREWTLAGKAKKKGAEGGGVKCRVCPKCFGAQFGFPTKCAYCGHVFESGDGREIEQKDGHLVEIDAAALRAKIQAKREQGAARTMPDLIALGVKRGYKNPRGWAYNMMKARGGK